MGRFEKWRYGKYSFTLSGEELSLKIPLSQRIELLDCRKPNGETDFLKASELVTRIMKSNYPEEPIDDLKSFVEDNINNFLEELPIQFGWTTREDVNLLKEQMKRELMETPIVDKKKADNGGH